MTNLERIIPHRHNDVDSPKLYLGDSVLNAPQEAITTASAGDLSTGGLEAMTTADTAILNNALTRIGELEDLLQLYGLVK